MNLWLLQPVDAVAARKNTFGGSEVKRWTWDCAYGFVVRAESEESARKLAAIEAGDEERDAWTNPALSTCEVLDPNGEADVVMRDFCTG